MARLQGDGTWRITGLSARAAAFNVSGYRVLHKWLTARRGEVIDAALQRQIHDLVWRLEALLHWFDAADAVLAASLARPLTRGELGLGGEVPLPALNSES